MSPCKPLIELLRRALKSHYKKLFLNNRMIMQCYNLDVDSDIGLHYVLFIPDTDKYEDPFYDMDIVLYPKVILDTYTTGHKELDALRKERGLKTKNMKEAFHVFADNNLVFEYYLDEELVTTTKVHLEPSDPTGKDEVNIAKTYANLIDRLKAGGAALHFNGRKLNLQYRITNCPEIYFYQVKLGKTTIRIPFSKSTFVGMTKLDKFEFSIAESEIPDIYVYTINFSKGGLEDVFWGYILNY